MPKIINFPDGKELSVEIGIKPLAISKIDACSSALMVFMQGLKTSGVGNWEEIANASLMATIEATHKADFTIDEAHEFFHGVRLEVEDENG